VAGTGTLLGFGVGAAALHAGEAMRWRLVLDEEQAVTRMRTVSGETLTQKFNTNTHTAADVHRWLATREDPTARVDMPTLGFPLYDLGAAKMREIRQSYLCELNTWQVELQTEQPQLAHHIHLLLPPPRCRMLQLQPHCSAL